MNIWERRNLAYFDRRQRLLAEERQRQQQQQQQGGDVSVSGEESTTTDSNEEEEPQAGVPLELSVPLSSVQRDQQERQIDRPTGFICAADDPQWREMTSRNIMGDYDPQRASRDPAYQYAWTSCQRLVNMRRSGVNPDDFIPTNPRLAALLEHRRRENARERHEEESAKRQQQQQSVKQEGDAQQHNMMMADGSRAVQEIRLLCSVVPAAPPAPAAAPTSSRI